MSTRREKIVRAIAVLGATALPFGFVAAAGWLAWRKWRPKPPDVFVEERKEADGKTHEAA